MERVSFYIDGFNFFHGLRRMRSKDSDWQKFYWIDIVKLFRQFVGENQILQKVYYFSAPDHEPDRLLRQRVLFQANERINGSVFEVINGMFYRKKVTCKTCFNRFFTYEEKLTDVNISINMLDDCFLNDVDTLVLVSADSDLLSTLQRINERFPGKKLRVYFPPGNTSSALMTYMRATRQKVIALEKSKRLFNNAVMPDTITTKDGSSFTVPLKWKSYTPSSHAPSPFPIVVNATCPHCNRTIIIPNQIH